MIYKKDDIDMSLVTCPYEEQSGYIAIEDEYTNNVLKLSGYIEIKSYDFFNICDKRIFVDKLEPYALKSPINGVYYAQYILKGRFELGEAIISTNAECAYFYASYVLDRRFELGEPVIATNAEYSYMYAADLMPNRFELGEPVIATNAHYSYRYACDVLKGRFDLGEPTITTNTNYKKLYERHFSIAIATDTDTIWKELL